jgi:phosphopantothenoylcysteine decarboxylase / phosphopantothenate---cysteine ligase
MLEGKRIVLGVTGGIAVYKAVELLRLCVKAGAEVHVVMTAHAREFVTPLTFQTLSGNPVHSELFDLYQEKEIGHISLADRADLFVVAPATANIIGKVACGLADDLLSTTLMATRAPILFVPAMNVNMWENSIFQSNMKKLEDLGGRFMEPETGELACGYEGKGKFPDPEKIFAEIGHAFHAPDLEGETVLVTAGPSVEKIDPVRFLSNFSSGKMGYAIAATALRRGARVILISGPTSLNPPNGVDFCPVSSAAEMYEAVMEHLPAATIVIKAAAVADFRPAAFQNSKIKKGEEETWLVELERTPDILAELGKIKEKRILVGFAAETENLLENARQKLERKNLDLMVANDVTSPGAGFGADTNVVTFLFPDREPVALPCLSKEAVAHRLLDQLVEIRGGRE